MKKLKVGLLLFIVSIHFLKAQELERIEPPHWYVGMVNNNLSLLVYGKDIAKSIPNITYKGVKVREVVRTQNPNYLFLDLNLDDEVQPGKFTIEFVVGKTSISREYELMTRQPDSRDRVGFDASDAIYLITPDRFANGDPSNDSVVGMKEGVDRQNKDGRHGGDLQGIIDHLDYIKEMGFTSIWINPVVENDMPDYSYHGYAPTDLYLVDKRYGSNVDYLELCRIAKEKGIKIIKDMIMNHVGSEHWFVLDPPSDDWLNTPSTTYTNHRRTALQDIHASETDKREFSDGWFVPSMPDLNQRNRLLATYLIQNSLWWIEYSGISGIRMDTYSYPDKDFMTEWNCAVMEEYPNFSIVGEEWSLTPSIISYWQKGKLNHDGYTSCLNSMMDFPTQFALTNALLKKENLWGNEEHPSTGWIELYESLAQDFLYADPMELVVFPDNHDVSRIFTRLGEDKDLLKMAITYFSTTRGIPQFYYGTELLMSNTGDLSHGNIRSDFPGGWPKDKASAKEGKGLTEEQSEVQDHMRTLLNWRQGSKAIQKGKLIHFVPEDGTYIFFRVHEEEKVMIALNKNENNMELELDRFQELLEGVTSMRSIIDGKLMTIQNSIVIEGKQAVVFELLTN